MLLPYEYTVFKGTASRRPSAPDQAPFDKISRLVEQTKTILFSAHSIFPLDLFPDYITIDENKVNFVYHSIFGSEDVHSALIEDITDVQVNSMLFFGNLTVVDSSNRRHPIIFKINLLKKGDALRARRIIQGLISAKRAKLEFPEESRKFAQDLELLGEATLVE